MSRTTSQILEERGNNYGEFRHNAQVSQDLKSVIDTACQRSSYIRSHAQAEAMDNICQKLARIANGNPSYEDNWQDIIGYAQLVLNDMQRDFNPQDRAHTNYQGNAQSKI